MGDRHLETLSFDNTYARLPDAFHAKLNPTPFSSPPYLVSLNAAAADLIDLDLEEAKRPEFAALLSLRRLAAPEGEGRSPWLGLFDSDRRCLGIRLR